MASRSWNRVELIGNLTRDPELRYTGTGTAVASIGLATNRTYVSEGERREEADFHRVVAWGKLGELCNQLLKKGSRVFFSGRLQYREWETQDGQKRREAEIILEDMILLTPKSGFGGEEFSEEVVTRAFSEMPASRKTPSGSLPENEAASGPPVKGPEDLPGQEPPKEKVDDSDLPF